MQNSSRPLAILYGYRSSANALSFIGRKGLITLSGQSRRIEKILRLCNGMTTVKDIVDQIPSIKPESIIELLMLCEKMGIVKDSREIYLSFHQDSANPAYFSQNPGADEIQAIMATPRLRVREGNAITLHEQGKSALIELTQKRRSVRHFKKAQIPENVLSGLLKTTYSKRANDHWSVPSGGAMYPLDLYLIVPNDNQTVPKGLYRWNPEKNELITVTSRDPGNWVFKTFNAKTLLENAAYILCIAANLKRPALKYGNRAYRNTLIEAGHVAQNAYLYCAEQNIGIVEYAGFCEDILSKEIGLESPYETVLTTLVLGIEDQDQKRNKNTDQKMVLTAHELELNLVGDKKPIVEVSCWEPKVGDYTMPLWAGAASYLPPSDRPSLAMKKRCRSFATGHTSSEAIVKTLAEGFERYALEQRKSEHVERATKLDGSFVDPRVFVPYADLQYRILAGLKKFNPEQKIGWVEGARHTSGSKIWVPTDLVFYTGQNPGNRRGVFYEASSNGVAAHTDREIAIKTALYELIERDAFSVMWYTKRSPRRIPISLLSSSLKERVSHWEKLGYQVSMLDLTLDGPPVILTVIWSDQRTPALFSGAGCRPKLLDALNRAFDEAEFMAMTWYRRKPKKHMLVSDIKSVDDHGLFYLEPKNLVHTKWLLKTEHPESTTKDFSGDLNHLDPVVVDITPNGTNSGLTVVRVLSENLTPINFGYGSEHRGHQRIKMLQLDWSMEYPSIPHFFA